MEQQYNSSSTQPYQNPAAYVDTAPLSLGNYLVMLIVGGIPLVGFIMMLVWGFSSGTNKNRQNYARAVLVLMAIGVVLSILFSTTIFALIASMGNRA